MQIADLTLGKSLSGAVKLTKNAVFDKYKYLDMVLDLMDAEVFAIQW